MIHKFLGAICLIGTIALGGCNKAQLDQFQVGFSNAVATIQTVNADIAKVSQSLGANCIELQNTAGALNQLGSSVSNKVAPAISGANAVIVNWCQAPPQSIAQAIQATAAEIVAAKAAYKAAKAGGLSPMSDGAQIAANIAKGIEIVAKIAAVEEKVMPYAMLIGGLFPGVASALSIIAIAQPWIDKAVAAAPAVEAAVQAGAPIIDAINSAGPQVLDHFKQALAVYRGGSPQEISDNLAIEAFAPMVLGRNWTEEEQNRWFERASGQQTNQW